MGRIGKYIAENPLHVLLLALPVVLVAQLQGWSAVALFIVAAVGIIPLAAIIGDATEDLAAHTDPRVGALLNASLGNAAELIITVTAVQAGLLELVKASITGSITSISSRPHAPLLLRRGPRPRFRLSPPLPLEQRLLQQVFDLPIHTAQFVLRPELQLSPELRVNSKEK